MGPIWGRGLARGWSQAQAEPAYQERSLSQRWSLSIGPTGGVWPNSGAEPGSGEGLDSDRAYQEEAELRGGA